MTDYANPTKPKEHATNVWARQQAAIRLRVPDSGIDWLDDMIRKSLRNEFAGQAMAGFLAAADGSALDVRLPIKPQLLEFAEANARASYRYADAMLAERDKEVPGD